jgi:hypothetical protein
LDGCFQGLDECVFQGLDGESFKDWIIGYFKDWIVGFLKGTCNGFSGFESAIFTFPPFQRTNELLTYNSTSRERLYNQGKQLFWKKC